MNETIYQLADSGGSVRIVVQKKPDGDFIIGISNGKDRPLICQGARETVWNEFESRLPQYLNELKPNSTQQRKSPPKTQNLYPVSQQRLRKNWNRLNSISDFNHITPRKCNHEQHNRHSSRQAHLQLQRHEA